VLAPLYAWIGDTTLVLLGLACGNLLIRACATLPDIDYHDSVPRRVLGEVLTGILLVSLLLSAVDLIVHERLFHRMVSLLPLGFAPSILLVLLLL